MFRRVVHTAGSARISIAHGTAAWNCVHGFLDQGIASSNPQIRDFFFALNTWIEVFDLFLARGSNNKFKPMKQVIITLAEVLSQNPDEKIRKSLKGHLVTTTVLIIHQPGGSSSIKLIFQFLEHVIHKGIIGASDVVLQHAGESSLREEGSKLDETAAFSQRSNSTELIHGLNVPQVESLISNILDWARYPDTATAAGVLLVVLCKSLQKHSSLKSRTQYSPPGPPLWANPIKRALRKEPSMLEIFGLYVLPGLLRLDASYAKFLLDTLPLKELQQGKAEDFPVVDVKISLLVLRECVKLNLIDACGMISYHQCLVDSFGVKAEKI